MKLTEPKVLDLKFSQKLDYIYNRKGRKHIRNLSNTSLEISKRHLGVLDGKISRNDDSPNSLLKPQWKRQAIDIFKQNSAVFVDSSSYYPSIFDISSRKSQPRQGKGIYSPEEAATKFTKFRDTNIRLIPLKKTPSKILTTKDIEGAIPMKFRHAIKKFVKEANNNKTHINFNSRDKNWNGEKPFRPSIRVFNPYHNAGFGNIDMISIPEVNKFRVIKANQPNYGLNVRHSRNRSVDPISKIGSRIEKLSSSLDSLISLKWCKRVSERESFTPSTNVTLASNPRNGSSPVNVYK